MAGVSSESLKAALAEVEPRLSTAPLSLANELFGILGTLDGSAGLRRALTDPSRTAEEKSGLIRGILAGKVSADAEQIAASLAASRWADARDIGDALETIAATVAIAVAESKGAAAGGGASGLETLENDLFAFNTVVASSHELQSALVDPAADPQRKAELALKLVPNASEEAQLLIRQAVVAPRGVKPVKLVERFAELAAKRQERWIATAEVTRALTGEQFNRLQAGLNALYGRDLKVNVAVEPTLIGGIRVKVGDEVVDASVLTKLGELRRKLAS
ncbi:MULTISPECIES: F0F1 ATP synthase subunit delta [Arthrobacter]|uniref:ATP synthase subunit delta n=2 Tax=Arthrobacter TaxID=1663 RepID=A0ABU9KNH0_9MICC|nr:F0F1 ATP synthase subunit delta [Arthrobacter sp. YJM1]MDP5228388.1 F0F1 ATP synthase subunit delta [Arthrobacter sp. YJM1]